MRLPRAKMGARYGRRGRRSRSFSLNEREIVSVYMLARIVSEGGMNTLEGVEDYGEIGEEFQPNGSLCFENIE